MTQKEDGAFLRNIDANEILFAPEFARLLHPSGRTDSTGTSAPENSKEITDYQDCYQYPDGYDNDCSDPIRGFVLDRHRPGFFAVLNHDFVWDHLRE